MFYLYQATLFKWREFEREIMIRDRTNYDGETPLHIAAFSGCLLRLYYSLIYLRIKNSKEQEGSQMLAAQALKKPWTKAALRCHHDRTNHD